MNIKKIFLLFYIINGYKKYILIILYMMIFRYKKDMIINGYKKDIIIISYIMIFRYKIILLRVRNFFKLLSVIVYEMLKNY
jgi:hypothetical protein